MCPGPGKVKGPRVGDNQPDRHNRFLFGFYHPLLVRRLTEMGFNLTNRFDCCQHWQVETILPVHYLLVPV